MELVEIRKPSTQHGVNAVRRIKPLKEKYRTKDPRLLFFEEKARYVEIDRFFSRKARIHTDICYEPYM